MSTKTNNELETKVDWLKIGFTLEQIITMKWRRVTVAQGGDPRASWQIVKGSYGAVR